MCVRPVRKSFVCHTQLHKSLMRGVRRGGGCMLGKEEWAVRKGGPKIFLPKIFSLSTKIFLKKYFCLQYFLKCCEGRFWKKHSCQKYFFKNTFAMYIYTNNRHGLWFCPVHKFVLRSFFDRLSHFTSKECKWRSGTLVLGYQKKRLWWPKRPLVTKGKDLGDKKNDLDCWSLMIKGKTTMSPRRRCLRK